MMRTKVQRDAAGLGHNAFSDQAVALIVRSSDRILRRLRNLCITRSNRNLLQGAHQLRYIVRYRTPQNVEVNYIVPVDQPAPDAPGCDRPQTPESSGQPPVYAGCGLDLQDAA